MENWLILWLGQEKTGGTQTLRVTMTRCTKNIRAVKRPQGSASYSLVNLSIQINDSKAL